MLFPLKKWDSPLENFAFCDYNYALTAYSYKNIK